MAFVWVVKFSFGNTIFLDKSVFKKRRNDLGGFAEITARGEESTRDLNRKKNVSVNVL